MPASQYNSDSNYKEQASGRAGERKNESQLNLTEITHNVVVLSPQRFNRGDVVMAIPPDDPKNRVIKRVIALVSLRNLLPPTFVAASYGRGGGGENTIQSQKNILNNIFFYCNHISQAISSRRLTQRAG